jgi:hypothetical protein
MADHSKQFEVEVKVLHRHEIDDADCDAFLEQRRALGDKDTSMFRSVLVGWADDFDGRDEMPPAPRIEDPNLVLVVIG